MLPGDAPRPPTLEISHEWLWLANAAEWRPGRLLDQNVQAGEHDGVVLLPKQIVGPRSLREDEPHSSMRVRSRPLPASSSATDCRRRSALAGGRGNVGGAGGPLDPVTRDDANRRT